MATIIRGRVVMRDDEIVARGLGEPVRFVETLQKE
jgi:dihydroorotase